MSQNGQTHFKNLAAFAIFAFAFFYNSIILITVMQNNVMLHCFQENRHFAWKMKARREFQLPQNILCWKLAQVSGNCLILLRSWIICQKRKTIWSLHTHRDRFFTFLLINQDLIKIEKNPEYLFVYIIK